MRWAEQGISPLKALLIGVVVLGLMSYFVFEKQLPFTHHYTIKAVVRDSNLLASGSPVRIGGVDVGKVTSTGRYGNTNLAQVTMEIDSDSGEIRKDATIAIRPRLFLEGNFYVQLSPGTPSAPPLADGGTIPVDHTAEPVQLDQVLGAFPASIRVALQQAVQGFGEALDTKPTAAQDRGLDPSVRGLTGAQAINKTFDTSASSLRDSAIVSEALTGPTGTELRQTIRSFGRASAGLAAADRQLTSLVSDFDQTVRATASQQQSLRRAVALLAPTVRNANFAFSALYTAFPTTERFANALAGALPQLPPTIHAALPWLAQARPLLSQPELQGLVRALSPAAGSLAVLAHDTLRFLPKIDAFNRCISGVFLPTGNIAINDGALSAGVPNYQEFWYAMAGQAAEGQGADGNGNYLRINASGGPYTVESGQTNFLGENDVGFARMPAKPLRTRPAYPNGVPPLQRRVPCYTQPVPDVNGPASFGPADGSRPNAPRPPRPNDPSDRKP
ncbi:MAG: MCE family protein [Solirubrobacterales bacterium]|nr:MCE family protein [Solirubrobacterales bacterium]